MAIAISTDFQAAFKEVYGTGSDVFNNQQNLKAKFFKELEVGAEKPSALGIITPVTMTGNEAGRSINEDENYESPGLWNPQRPVVMAKEFIAPFSLSGKSIELSKTDKQAFGVSTNEIMKDTLARAHSQINRQAWGVGTGQMSLVNGAVVAAADVVVDNILPFRRDMKIDIFASVGGAKEADARTITSINVATLTLTLDAAVSVSDNGVIVMSGVLDGAPAGGKELSGFRKCCDTTVFGSTYENLSAVTNPEWRGNVVDAGAVPVSQDLMQQTLDRVWLIGGGEPKLMVSNTGIRRSFLQTEVQKSRYENSKIDSGYTVLKWNDLTWVVDKDHELGEISFIDKNHFKRYETRPMHLIDDDGNTVLRVSGRDAIAGQYRYIGDLGSWKRNAHGRLTNLTDPLLVAGGL